MNRLFEGEVHRIAYPMVVEPVQLLGDDGPYETKSWRPGVRYELYSPYGGSTACADGVGQMVLQVVSTHKPGRYPERVFYIRQWVDPLGKTFGKKKLRITTSQAFMSMLKGFRYEYEVEP